MLCKILFAALLAQTYAITPRRRALKRVDVPKASKLKKQPAASTKKQAATEDVGFAHRYFSTQIDESRFFFRALAVRGGGEEKPLITPEKVLSYGGAALLAGMTVYLVEKLPRSGGQAPAFLSAFGVPEPAAAVLFHLGYVLHCFLVLAVMPAGLKSAVFSPAGVVLVGTVFPLVESIKAAASTSTASEHDWLQYWILHGCLSVVSQDAGRFLSRFGDGVVNHFYEFQFYSVLWLILPMTDGSAVVNEQVTKKYITPLIQPTVRAAEGWLATLVLGAVNAGHIWFFAGVFTMLPAALKRLAVVGVGTAFPVAATMVAASTGDSAAEDKWLLYWSCFSLVTLVMTLVERTAGAPLGLYTVCLGATLYLMLPMFNGADVIFRNVLVPLAGQREALLLKDAKMLARTMVKQLPASRHGEAGEAVAQAFLDEAKKQGV